MWKVFKTHSPAFSSWTFQHVCCFPQLTSFPAVGSSWFICFTTKLPKPFLWLLESKKERILGQMKWRQAICISSSGSYQKGQNIQPQLFENELCSPSKLEDLLDFDWNCNQSIGQFGEHWHFYESSSYKHNRSLHFLGIL